MFGCSALPWFPTSRLAVGDWGGGFVRSVKEKGEEKGEHGGRGLTVFGQEPRILGS